jgi:hypothetical protein
MKDKAKEYFEKIQEKNRNRERLPRGYKESKRKN